MTVEAVVPCVHACLAGLLACLRRRVEHGQQLLPLQVSYRGHSSSGRGGGEPGPGLGPRGRRPGSDCWLRVQLLPLILLLFFPQHHLPCHARGLQSLLPAGRERGPLLGPPPAPAAFQQHRQLALVDGRYCWGRRRKRKRARYCCVAPKRQQPLYRHPRRRLPRLLQHAPPRRRPIVVVRHKGAEGGEQHPIISLLLLLLLLIAAAAAVAAAVVVEEVEAAFGGDEAQGLQGRVPDLSRGAVMSLE